MKWAVSRVIKENKHCLSQLHTDPCIEKKKETANKYYPSSNIQNSHHYKPYKYIMPKILHDLLLAKILVGLDDDICL